MSVQGGASEPGGELGLRIIRASEREVRDRFDQLTGRSVWPAHELSLAEIVHHGMPRRGLDDRVNTWRAGNVGNLVRGARRALTARALGLSNFYGSLYLTHVRADGEVVDYGLASMRVVTTAGVGFLVDSLQGLVEPELLRFHGLGTGAAAEATGDTALGTELTTAYNPDSTRATGTQTEAAGNVYRTVGTNTVDGAAAVTEHGLFTTATPGTGVLLDRSVFAVLNLASGDSLASTFDFTMPAGGN